MKKIKRQVDLNEIAFQRLKDIRPNRYGVILYHDIREKICRSLSLKKVLCHRLLVDFRKEGKIEFVRFRGIRILKKDGKF